MGKLPFVRRRPLPFFSAPYHSTIVLSTQEIGEIVMLKLKERDEVAYVRFASVYREFKDVDTFLKELKELMNKK